MRNTFFKILMIVSFLVLAVFIYAWITGTPGLTGPMLTLFFVSLAISFYGHGKLKKFAYTIWIFAAVTVSMNYPQLFRQVRINPNSIGRPDSRA